MTKYTLIIDEKTREILYALTREESHNTPNGEEAVYLYDLSEMLEDLKTDQINDLTAWATLNPVYGLPTYHLIRLSV